MRNKAYIKYILILLLPIGLLLNYVSSLNSKMTQKIYSNFLYKGLCKAVSGITRHIPVSVAEILFILLVIIVVSYIGITVIRLIKNKSPRYKIFKNALINILAWIGIIYFTFIIMWGLNYNRPHISEVLDIEIMPATMEELAELGKDLIHQANELRSKVQEDERGIMVLENGYRSVFERAPSGFEAMAEIYPEIQMPYGQPKRMLMSKIISYTGIWGIYSPFTFEANVNINIPAPFLPAITCHEMAHQLGYAREDEANYIAYLTCKLHEDYDFNYSGILFAFINVMNELYLYDSELYGVLMQELDEGVIRDIREVRAFKELHDGNTKRVFSQYNDLYLKANRQKEGEKSYRRVVDLIIAEYKMKLGI